MTMSWKNLRMIHEIDDEDDFGMRDETEQAYKKGCKKGYMKALMKLKELGYRIPEEMKQGMQEEMGERSLQRDYGDDDGETGERVGYSWTEGRRGGLDERRGRDSRGRWY